MMHTATVIRVAERPSIGVAECPLPIARQAIVNADRQVFGHELLNVAQRGNDHHAASDAGMLFNLLSHLGTEGLSGSQPVFLNCTHDSLTTGYLDLVHPNKLVLEIPSLPGDAVRDIEWRARVLTDLHRRGYRLAFNHTVLTPAYASWLPLAAYIKLDLSLLEAELFERLACAAQTYTTAQLIAEKVETAAQFDQMAGYGIGLFQGYWLAMPKPVAPCRAIPTQASVVQLLALLRRNPPPETLEKLFRDNTALAFSLLHLVDSSGHGDGQPVASLRQAIETMGNPRLLLWAGLLLKAAHSGMAPCQAEPRAQVRGRLTEWLAGEVLPADVGASAYLVGLFSLLDGMLDQPMQKAAAWLPLPPAAQAALLRREGPLGTVLALAIACETGQQTTAAELATTLGISAQTVQRAQLHALEWACANAA